MIPVEAPEIDIDPLARAVGSGVTIIDVREPGGYVAGRIPGAVLIPMGQLPGCTAELDRQARVYVACASGRRSAVMTGFLRSAGFDAYSVAGGTSGWACSGQPVVGGAPHARELTRPLHEPRRQA